MAKAPIAAADEVDSPLELFMRALFTQILASMARTLSAQDLSLHQLAALHLLDARRQLRIGDLAADLALPMSGASRLVTDMVARGLVVRRESEEDRRAKVVTLSKTGHALMATISRQRIADGDAAMASLGGEIGATFAQVFAQLRRDGLATK